MVAFRRLWSRIANMPLRFLHLTATDGGGAGLAARRLHEGLLVSGHPSSMVVLDQMLDDPQTTTVGSRAFRWRRLAIKAMLKPLARPDYYFQDQRMAIAPRSGLVAAAVAARPDVIVAHFLSHFLSFEDLQAVHKATGAVVIWHLLDMATMTGGCHYAWSCEGYLNACGNCPALRFGHPNDASARTMAHKLAAVGQIDGSVVAGSSTLAAQARSSALFKARRIDTVLMGVSDAHFTPHRRPGARQALGVPSDRTVVFFGAQKFSQRRKGMSILAEALSLMRDRWLPEQRPLLLIAGDVTDFSGWSGLGYEARLLGFVGSEALADAYAAADVFVCPSIEDSGPMMVNEALMSGTPVAAFPVGVVEDLVQPGETGEIALEIGAGALADAIARVLGWTAEKRSSASARCRDVAVRRSASEVQVESFIAIATSLRSGA